MKRKPETAQEANKRQYNRKRFTQALKCKMLALNSDSLNLLQVALPTSVLGSHRLLSSLFHRHQAHVETATH